MYEAYENAGSCVSCLKVIAQGGRIRRRPRDRTLFGPKDDDDARLC